MTIVVSGAPKGCAALTRKRLDRAGVAHHIDAVATTGEHISVRERAANHTQSSATSGELATARDRLLAGDVEAVQIVFFLDGAWWCDTIMRANKDYRLVRMRQDPA